MNIAGFIKKWSRAQLSERAASQEHFLDLCELLDQPKPAEFDPAGIEYTFEKGVKVTAPASQGSKGERGFADAWWRGKFGWEYKRKDKYNSLDDAYRQLLQYREALENPKLLIVSDITRTEIHTNFTGFKSDTHVVELDRLDEPGQLDLLRRVFTDPDSFKPDETAEQVTEIAAKAIGEIAQGLRQRGCDPHDAAHFLMKVMFCLFAEDVELLPRGLFEKMLGKCKHDPPRLKSQMDTLFAAMRTGGDFGIDEIAYFNGGLFDDAKALELTETDIASLIRAASKDWGAVEPSVFGTLFERSLDPDKRAQIGAHYTSRDDIMLVIEPVIVRPLRQQWDETKTAIEKQVERRRTATTKATRKKADNEIADLLDGYQQRLASVRVLDPACGSGNFLYVAIQQLLALEKEMILDAASPEIGVGLLSHVRPTQLLGIEINPYAAELAQVVIWIGYLQWMRDNGFNAPRDPILEPIESIENRDAILAWEDEQGEPIPAWREGAVCRGQAEWPEADFIVGNPPFLGSKQFRVKGLEDPYLECLFAHFNNVPNTADLCAYWLDLAADHVFQTNTKSGLLATQAIRGINTRQVLKRVCDRLTIFDAWNDKEWVLDGAAVRVSIICFSEDELATSYLNGLPVSDIHSDLSAGIDLSIAKNLSENAKTAFQGQVKVGSFELESSECRQALALPNPTGNPNFDVLRPWMNATDATKRCRGYWIIDYAERSLQNASGYEHPLMLVEERVKPKRLLNRDRQRRENWWRLGRSGSDLRESRLELSRVLISPRVSKHRIFTWAPSILTPDSRLVVITVQSDFMFGILQSAIHELWVISTCSWHGVGNDPTYNPTTCFETFPLPWPPGAEPAEGDPQRPLHDAIASAAEQLNDQRERWLNPPEWIDEIAKTIDAQDDFADVARVSGEEARRLIRQSAIDAAAAKDPQLKKRTLTNLYNERPTWLALAHQTLDEAVLNAYAAVDPEGDWDASWAEVFVETGAGQPLPEGHALTERREEVEQSILANLLRMNLHRASEQ